MQASWIGELRKRTEQLWPVTGEMINWVLMLKDCAMELGTLTTPPLRFWSSMLSVNTPGPA